MKLLIINKYHSINFCIYSLFLWTISCTMAYFVIKPPFAEIWLLFFGIFIMSEIILPISFILSILELIFFKLKILKYKHLEVNVSPKVQKIVYTLAALSFAYYLWYKFYFEPILDKMLEFD